jgi:hypothetical protein
MRGLSLIFFGLIFIAPNIFGQTRCPSGVQAGNVQCMPDSNGGNSKPRPLGEWIETWGAIVTSTSSSEAWVSIGKLSQKETEAEALQDCHASGVADCKVLLSYRNQCAALVTSSAATNRTVAAGAPTTALAEGDALRECGRLGGRECSVIYSECTKQIFKRF